MGKEYSNIYKYKHIDSCFETSSSFSRILQCDVKSTTQAFYIYRWYSTRIILLLLLNVYLLAKQLYKHKL